MIYLYIYIVLSYFLAPALAGLLDRKHKTDYPINNLGFIFISPILVPIIICVYFVCSISEIDFPKFNIFERIYNFCKGEK